MMAAAKYCLVYFLARKFTHTHAKGKMNFFSKRKQSIFLLFTYVNYRTTVLTTIQ